MIDEKRDLDINRLKPAMKMVASISDLEISKGMVAMAKADGEFTLFRYERDGECFTINRYGHVRKDFPALNEAVELLNRKTELKSAEILCELYAWDQGRPQMLPNLIRWSKGKDRKLGKVHLGVWDLHSVNGIRVLQDYEWILEELTSWFENGERVYVLPFVKPQHPRDLRAFWKTWVEDLGYEGVVVRANADIIKVKPVLDVDAVVVAINKVGGTGNPNKRYKDQMVSSVRVALMDKEGFFIVLGDCTIADPNWQKVFWELQDLKVSEDSKRVWVQPAVIIQIQYTAVFPGSICEKVSFDGKYHARGEMQFCKMRNPRFIRPRGDKQVDSKDLRLEQMEGEGNG